MFFFLLLIICFFPVNVYASSAYIYDLQILNGSLSIPFNQENNIYTIYLDNDATFVDFSYQLEDEGAILEIIDSKYYENQENVMILKVNSSDNTSSQTYTFYLEKENTESVFSSLDTSSSLNITKKERSPFLAPIIIISCVTIIVFLFYIIIVRYVKKQKD